MSFSETVLLFLLVLVVFGPRKLPEIARQAGKLLAELRRASNEFKSQLETEISHLEVEERKRNIMLPTAAPPGAVASLSLNSSSSQPALREANAAATIETEEGAAHADPAPIPSSAAASPVLPSNSALVPAAGPSESQPLNSQPQDSHV